MFSVDIRPSGQARIVALRGELDYESAVQLREATDTLLGGPQPPPLVVIDCAALRFCDSSGISGLIRIYQRLSAGGGVLRLAALPGAVARAFALTGLEQVMAVHTTAREALYAGGGTHRPHSEGAPPSARTVSER
ncbi:STAS domain-containing protein [Streptomyces sp. NBC_00388]|uniref:STAS domain-containing protein n=1 Tax=Streptomyces sp. NBC_00388 TaxID=2975735 RepID=UPI002E1A581D